MNKSFSKTDAPPPIAPPEFYENELERIAWEVAERMGRDPERLAPLQWRYILEMARAEYVETLRPKAGTAWDDGTLSALYYEYRHVCLKYNQEISLYDYRLLVGVSQDTVARVVTPSGGRLVEIAGEDSENALHALATGQDMTRHLAKLNHAYGWSKDRPQELRIEVKTRTVGDIMGAYGIDSKGAQTIG